jgi:hypothetical protein
MFALPEKVSSVNFCSIIEEDLLYYRSVSNGMNPIN